MADVFLIRQAMKSTDIDAEIEVLKDGEIATRFFDALDDDPNAACPSLIVLDINLPKKQGGEVLHHLRKSIKCASAVVIAVSTSNSAKDREEMIKLGAKAYFRKPSEHAEFMKLGEIIRDLLYPANS